MFQIILSHNRMGNPHHPLLQGLARAADAAGHGIRAVNYCDSLDEAFRTRRLLMHLRILTDPFILVGHGMGAQVSLAAAMEKPPSGLFLLSPSLFRPGQNKWLEPREWPPMEIVHGWSDAREPCRNAIAFAGRHHVPLHLLPGDHRLVDALPLIRPLFLDFLERLEASVSAKQERGHLEK